MNTSRTGTETVGLSS